MPLIKTIVKLRKEKGHDSGRENGWRLKCIRTAAPTRTVVFTHSLGGQRDPEAITHQHHYQVLSLVFCHKTRGCSQKILLTTILLLLLKKINQR